MTRFPRLVIGGVSSGVGKTTLAVGLARAFSRRGLAVAAFKCGPDYLDPSYLRRASGRDVQNLDGWMMGKGAVLETFRESASGVDLSIIEGVMGLFDGASPDDDEGSTAQIAKWLASPVLLVADASGMARSLAALSSGFVAFDRDLNIAALAANRIGSAGHLALLRSAVREPALVGGLEKQPELRFSERHLGLHTATDAALPERVIDEWAARVEAGFDLDRILAIAASAPVLAEPPGAPAASERRCRIGVAFDAAFHFYYADNLRRLERLGAELHRFSPLEARALPALDGLYFGGGYPELHARALSDNRALMAAISSLAQAGAPVYAECGGLMYLADAVHTLDGQRHTMVGLIRGEARMQPRRVALGYVEARTRVPSMLGPPGLCFRGHQFRYSDIERAPSASEPLYHLARPRGGDGGVEGFSEGNVVASYVHAHWASNPALAENFVNACVRFRRSRTGAASEH